MAEKKTCDPFSEEIIKQRRFPISTAIIIPLIVIIQILVLLFAILYDPTPQDRIDSYEITAEPNANGTVNLEYRFVWTALDENAELTWVEIGMPNKYFDFFEDAFSKNIVSYEKYIDGSYVSARLYLDKAYTAGETLSFSFKVCQRELLCKDENGYFYEFVPGWFNATPVESYRFSWKASPSSVSSNAPLNQNGYYAWQGKLPCGGFVIMRVRYEPDTFSGAYTAKYEEFYDEDAYDSLQSDKIGFTVLAVAICLVLLVVQIYMADRIISYHRGRGFLRGYGHHIHVYGRSNPRYEKEKEKHVSSRGGHRSGGCACACACACAGGGRAGCSQKDTVKTAALQKGGQEKQASFKR